MRSLLLVGFTALALSFSALSASAATMGEVARNSNVEWAALAQPAPVQTARHDALYVRDETSAAKAALRDKDDTSVADAIGTIAALAGAGVVLTLAAVGLRHVWTQDPIRDPLGDGPGFL